MEFVIRIIFIYVFFSLFLFFVYRNTKFFKRFRVFKELVSHIECYNKLKQGNFVITQTIDFPRPFFPSGSLIIFMFLFSVLFIFFLIVAIAGVQLDRHLSIRANIIFSTLFALLGLSGLIYFLKIYCIIFVEENGIKFTNCIKFLFTLGKFHYIPYDEIVSLAIKLYFRAGTKAVAPIISITSTKGKVKFTAEGYYSYDTLLLIAALKEKLKDKVNITQAR